MTQILRPTGFALVGLHLQDMGPLRNLTSISFTDSNGQPDNLYLIMGPNGSGKTTVLEAIYRAMSLLDAPAHASFGHEALDNQGGGFQLDARVVLDDGARARPFVLSIVAGSPGLLKVWSDEELQRVEADEHIVLQYERRAPGELVVRAPSSSPAALAFSDAILERAGDPPQDLFENAFGYPTVLYFPSNRGIRPPPAAASGITRPEGLGYAAAHMFEADGSSWAASLDNLFVWFAWLQDGREERCRALVNDLVFRGRKRLGEVDRQNLYVPVEVDEYRHRLHQLSSGERQLVQLVVRIASHMTGSTIVLIDETEQHLHLVMRRRLINIIKDWARTFQGLSFTITSHQAETYRLLAPRREEAGLVKGGCLVKPRFNRRS